MVTHKHMIVRRLPSYAQIHLPHLPRSDYKWRLPYEAVRLPPTGMRAACRIVDIIVGGADLPDSSIELKLVFLAKRLSGSSARNPL